MSKYSNRKTEFGGLTFDSKAEAKRWSELVILERMSQISNLRRQVAFELAPSVRLACAKRAKPALKYIADFVYIEKGEQVVEDTKGVLTEAFRIKQHLMKSVHGVDVRVNR